MFVYWLSMRLTLKDKIKVFLVNEKNRKGIVILVNKWDLVEKDTMSTRDYEKKLEKKLLLLLM